MTKDIELRLIDAPVPDGESIELDEILTSAPGPDIDGGIDLTDKEFAAFLEAARA